MNEPQTLAQRLAQGRIPAAEAERYATILAEALRKIHETGQVHGGVSPATILLAGSGLQLAPAPAARGIVTPYTAPELLAGQPPDSRSDLFAFGAVVYEMFSGRRAFEGDSPAALSAAINTSTPPSCGRPAVDRLVRNCLAKDPGARWQRMHKVLMELKLLAVSARRIEAPAAARREPSGEAGLRTEMQQLEAGVSARLQACEKTVVEIERAAARREPSGEAGLRAEMQQLEAGMFARLQACEKTVVEIERAAARREPSGEAGLRAEMQQLEAGMFARLQACEKTVVEIERAAARREPSGEAGLRAEMQQLEAGMFARLQACEKTVVEIERAAARREPSGEAGLRAEMQQLEAGMFARLQACEKTVVEVERAAARREPSGEAGLRAEMQQLEAGIFARMQACEKTVVEMQRAAAELRGQLAAVNSRLAAASERQVTIPEEFLEAAEARIAARIAQYPAAGGERLDRLEQSLDAARKHIATLHDNVAEDFLDFEKGLKSQAAAIQSARTAMGQTDDLVERVVEALESLQSAMLEPREERAVLMN
jgi:Mg2+ and Co2+ transporter CorA